MKWFERVMWLAPLLVFVLALGLLAPAIARDITGTGMDQGGLVTFLTALQTRVNAPRALSWTNFGQQAAGSASVAIGATYSYTIDGKSYGANAGTIATGSTTSTVQATGTNRLYIVSVATNGTYTVTAGQAVSYLIDPEWPTSLPTGYCPVGGVKVAVGTGAPAAFTMGVTTWNAASITATFYSLTRCPVDALDITNF